MVWRARNLGHFFASIVSWRYFSLAPRLISEVPR